MVPDKVTVPRKVSSEGQQPRTEEPGQIGCEPRVPHPKLDAEDLKEEAAAEPLRSRGKILAYGIKMFVEKIFSLLFELESMLFRTSTSEPLIKTLASSVSGARS